MKSGQTLTHPGGLRARLTWLVVVSLLPVFCYAIYASIQNQRERLARADADLLAIVRIASLVAERHVEGARQLLNAVASGPSLKGDAASAFCPAFLSNIRNATKFLNIGFIDKQGNLRCAAVWDDRAFNLSDRAYFKEALTTRTFSVGEYQIGRIFNRPTLNFGVPVYDDAGDIKGVAFAALDIALLSMTSIPLASGVELAITDRNGVILATIANQGLRVGERLGDQTLLAALQKAKDKTVEIVDAKGVLKIFATAAVVESEPGKGVYAVANIAKSAVIAPAQIELAWILAAISALALASLAIARWIGKTSILDPTRKLLQQVNDLAGEDVSDQSAGQKKQPNEIVALSGAFERMTGVLKAHDDARSQGVAALELSQGRLLTAQRMGHIGNWEYDVRHDQVWWSDQTFEIYGLDRSHAPGGYSDILAKVHPDDRLLYEQKQKQLWAGGSLDFEHRIVLGKGEVRWVHGLGEATFSNNGELSSLSGTVQDITDRRSAEEALQSTQNLMSMATRLSRLGAWEVALPDQAMVWSDEVFMIHELPLGTTPTVQEAISYYAPDSRPTLVEAVEACINAGLPFDLELELVTARANRLTVKVVGLAVRDQHGAIVRIQGAVQDITERRAEQTQLQLLQTVVSKLNDIVLITEAEPFDEPGPRIVFVNEAFEKMTGFSREEVIGKTPRILQGPKTQRSELDKIAKAIKKWDPIRVELINYKKNGEQFWVDFEIVPIADATGWYTHWVAVQRDITARKQSEEEILALNAELDIKVQKRTAELQEANEELESFSYSVSHDLRSPLKTIAGFSQLLEKADGNAISPKGRHYLSRIQAGSKVMDELIEGLLALAQMSRAKLKYEQTNLSILARHVETGCREQNPDRNVEFLIEDDLFTRGDPRLLLAVVQNLIGNAWKYTAQTKTARIEFFCEQGLDASRCFVVRDNGAGFDMKFADKLFRTFERLHSPSEFTGTGVGLAIVKRVVEKHGGRIWATSKVGEGATFRFTLGANQDIQ